MSNIYQNFCLSVFSLTKKALPMNDIRRDNERARQGIKPKILNEIPMRTPPEEDLSVHRRISSAWRVTCLCNGVLEHSKRFWPLCLCPKKNSVSRQPRLWFEETRFECADYCRLAQALTAWRRDLPCRLRDPLEPKRARGRSAICPWSCAERPSGKRTRPMVGIHSATFVAAIYWCLARRSSCR